MLLFFVFAKRRSRRPLDFFSHQSPTRCPSTKSYEINIFADPHPLTSAASIFYKKAWGEGACQSLWFQSYLRVPRFSSNSFGMRGAAKCTHNSFGMRSSEKSGWTGKLLTRRLKKNFYPEE